MSDFDPSQLFKQQGDNKFPDWKIIAGHLKTRDFGANFDIKSRFFNAVSREIPDALKKSGDPEALFHLGWYHVRVYEYTYDYQDPAIRKGIEQTIENIQTITGGSSVHIQKMMEKFQFMLRDETIAYCNKLVLSAVEYEHFIKEHVYSILSPWNHNYGMQSVLGYYDGCALHAERLMPEVIREFVSQITDKMHLTKNLKQLLYYSPGILAYIKRSAEVEGWDSSKKMDYVLQFRSAFAREKLVKVLNIDRAEYKRLTPRQRAGLLSNELDF